MPDGARGAQPGPRRSTTSPPLKRWLGPARARSGEVDLHAFTLLAKHCHRRLAGAGHRRGRDPQIAQSAQPQLPKIGEVRPGPDAWLWRCALATRSYTDATGTLFSMARFTTKNQRNLTEERVVANSRIDFSTLPLKDALMWKNGSGKRKLVVLPTPTAACAGALSRRCRR